MKRAVISLILILILTGCSEKASNLNISTYTLSNDILSATDSTALSSKTEGDQEHITVSAEDVAITTSGNNSSILSNIENYVGVYFYNYENDTSDLIEDQFIVLENVKDKIEGRYYGTSDDFDEAREGYYPGFFVSEMRNLKINKNEISFEVYLTERDMFSKPIKIDYESSEEIKLSENPIWVNSHIVVGLDNNPRKYNGKIINSQIILEVEGEKRVFDKVKNENSNVLGNSEKIETSNSNGNLVLGEYKKYLDSLDLKNINSINLAVNKYKIIKLSKKSVNEDLYRLFCNFYYTMLSKLNSNLEDLDELIEGDLKINGFVMSNGEAGPSIHEKSNFIKSIFFNSVSEGVQKFIDIENKANILMGEGYLFEDALLTMSWNKFSDLIVLYEKYIDDYGSYELEIKKAKNSLNFFLFVYTQYLDTLTFSYMSGDSDNEYELRDSYLRFVDIYPDSKYQPLIKGYLEILNSNGFKFDDKAKKYLTKNGMDVN